MSSSGEGADAGIMCNYGSNSTPAYQLNPVCQDMNICTDSMDCSGNKEKECYANEYAGIDCRIKNYYELLYEEYCEPHPASLFDTEAPLLYSPFVRADWLG